MMTRINNWLAVKLSGLFSTMGCFYVFLLLALLPLPFPAAMPYVQFISSAVLQLVALPLIAVASRVIQEQQAAHAASIAELHDKHDILTAQLTGEAK